MKFAAARAGVFHVKLPNVDANPVPVNHEAAVGVVKAVTWQVELAFHVAGGMAPGFVSGEARVIL